MTSEPAHTATRPASAPLWMKPGSPSPAISAAMMPPHMAISEFMATRPRDGLQRLRAHHVEAEPADAQQPGAHGEPRDRRGRDADRARLRRSGRGAGPSWRTAEKPIQPPTACTTMEPAKSWNSSPSLAFEEALLQAEVLVPDDAFEEGIEQADDQRRWRRTAGRNLRALGDAARDDRGHRRREGAQEEELDQREALRVEAFGAAADAPRR